MQRTCNMAAFGYKSQFRVISVYNVIYWFAACYLSLLLFFRGCEGGVVEDGLGLLADSRPARLMGSSWQPVSDTNDNQLTEDVDMGEEGREVVWSNLPQLEIVLAFLTLTVTLALSLLVLVWVKKQMSSGKGKEEEEQWICHPVIKPATTTQQPTSCQCSETKEKNKPKGLLERRGSSASLTIDLIPTTGGGGSVTPTRECTTEEFLLSVGNVLNRQQLRSCLKDVRALHREFCELPLNHPDKVHVPGSWSKNRYMTVIPNETTRVRLPVMETTNDELNGYINANYIRGYDGEEKAFIATQGPLAHTIVDLWTMVWSEHVPVIVMITKLWEKAKSKCEPYFPTELNSAQVYGDYTVTILSITNKDGYIVRVLEVQKGDEKKNVTHFWFDSWPDHRTPPNTHSLLSLAKEVEIARFAGGPQRRPSVAWLSSPSPIKDTVSPVLTLGTLELKQDDDDDAAEEAVDNKRLGADLLGSSKKRGRQMEEGEREHGDKFFKSPQSADGVFRFEGEGDSSRTSRSKSDESDYDSPLHSGSDATTHSVFWKFEKLSTGSGSYETAISPGWLNAAKTDSPASCTESERSPFRTSFDSPAFTSSSSSASSNKRWGKGQSSGESVTEGSLKEGGGPEVSPRWVTDNTNNRGKPAGPVLVHCSAGIGRTGCFIALSIGVNQLLWENNVDILSIVCRMRYDRGGMVQTAEQYEFIHRALALFERSLPDQSGE